MCSRTAGVTPPRTNDAGEISGLLAMDGVAVLRPTGTSPTKPCSTASGPCSAPRCEPFASRSRSGPVPALIPSSTGARERSTSTTPGARVCARTARPLRRPYPDYVFLLCATRRSRWCLLRCRLRAACRRSPLRSFQPGADPLLVARADRAVLPRRRTLAGARGASERGRASECNLQRQAARRRRDSGPGAVLGEWKRLIAAGRGSSSSLPTGSQWPALPGQLPRGTRAGPL